MRGLDIRPGFATLSLLALAACATPTPFVPQQPGGGPGYSDEQLASNRFRVSFEGNSVTPRATVEDYLVLRAAQVTAQAGYRYFLFDTRDTKRDTRYLSTFTGWPGWRGSGFYWHNWGFGPPYDTMAESVPITRYQAYAEIVLLTPEQARRQVRAIDAQDAIAHLGAKAAPAQPR